MKMEPALRIATGSIRLLPIVLLWLWGMGAVSVAAQSYDVTWLKASNLSNTPVNSEHPAIVADSFGYVHVLWSEDVGGEPFDHDKGPHSGNSIVYMRWDGSSWTPLMDILFVPNDPIAKFVAVDIDANNRLHAVWTGQSNLYYSNALSWQAESAHAWSQPVIVASNSARTRWESDVVADASGNVHILYATRGDEPGVYHIRSQDGGVTWEQPTKLSEPFDRLETSFSNVKTVMDGAGRIHAVWETNQEEGYGQAVYYARSTDGGQSWTAALQKGYRESGEFEVSWPYIIAVNESELHLIYVDGAADGRYHRISRDGGATWSDPYHIIPDMEGVNGYVFPVVDGGGRMHLIINMRTITQIGGIFYADWLGDSWSPVVRIDLTDQGGGAHYTAGAMRLGNELHVVWTQLSRGEIGHIYGIIPSISQTPPLDVPTPQSPAPTPSPRATEDILLPTTTPIPPPATLPPTASTPAPSTFSLLNPVVISIGTSLFLVGGVVLWTRVRPR